MCVFYFTNRCLREHFKKLLKTKTTFFLFIFRCMTYFKHRILSSIMSLSNYLLRLITDMRDILTKLDEERDLMRIEIYKPPDFNNYFERYIDEIVSAHIRRLFLTRHFPFAEFLVAFFITLEEYYTNFLGFNSVSPRIQVVILFVIAIICFVNVLDNFCFCSLKFFDM